ncbi:TSUP family transporter [Stackebrandtia soli]|uniref:TSUP family transporter n=1 Tax=Stackebrandtia soli TaxID=1892856 RepID=UPI0039EC7AD6
METVAPTLLLMLFVVALLAGCVDAVAGGGGLLTLPALLLAQVPPVHALATNKLQSSFGTLTSAVSMRRRGLTDGVQLTVPFLCALAGAALGAVSIQFVRTDTLQVAVPVVLVAIGLYFVFMPGNGTESRDPRMSTRTYHSMVVPGIGFYDGAFGPGTGSFFTAAGVSLRGQHLVAATAQAKTLNFATNIAALVVFLIGGKLMWVLGGIMAIGQIAGAYVGAIIVHRGGARLIRPIVVVMCVAMLVQYLWKEDLLPW